MRNFFGGPQHIVTSEDYTECSKCDGTGKTPKQPCGCLHSEIAALSRFDATPWADRSLVIYTTASPCRPCARAVIACQKVGLWIYKPTKYTNEHLEGDVSDAEIPFLSSAAIDHNALPDGFNIKWQLVDFINRARLNGELQV